MLDDALRTELNRSTHEAITYQDLHNIRKLDLSNRQIKEIEGLQHLQNLEVLDLSHNKIDDISALSKLDKLTDLNLRDNNISNLEAIENSRLTDLNLRDNNITNLDPLKTQTALINLNVRDNSINSVEPLKNLTKLSDVNLRYNQIQLIEPIIELPNLIDRLYVEGNPLVDLHLLTPLFDHNNLDIDIPRTEYTIYFSSDGGTYSEQKEIELKANSEDGLIHYTLDNSEVTSSSPVYNEPITITSSTNIRAKFFPKEDHKTNEYVQSYLIDETSTLPIITISTDEEHLYDHNTGIYTEGIHYQEHAPEPSLTGNYMQRGRQWERPIHIQLFETDGSLAMSQHAGIRIHGNHSRVLDQKSFRLYARSDYGQSRFQHSILSENNGKDFNRLLLRNSGQDYNKTFFRDAFIQDIVKDLEFDTQLYRPAKLFINGEDWGIYNLRERFDNHYFKRTHNIQDDDLELLEHNRFDEVIASHGDTITYEQLVQTIKDHDLSVPEHYEMVKQQININSFLDYYITQIYIDNNDWPHNNYNFYREKPYGKWQFALFDTDAAFNLREDRGPHEDSLERLITTRFQWATFIFQSLLENEEFEQEFIDRSFHYLSTIFSPEHVHHEIESKKDVLAPEMPSHIERWGTIGSMEEWDEHIDVLRDFAADRSRHMQSHLMRQFELDGYGKVSISSMTTDEFSINNTTADDLIDQWTGRYNLGQTIQIDFTNPSITASSSDSSVASVDDELNITLSGPGHTEIVFSDDADHQPKLVLDIEVLEVSLEKLSVEALEQQISLQPVSEDATWISNNTDSIEIIDNEKMMIHEAGMSTITAFNEEEIEAIYYVDAYEIADTGDQLDGQSGALEFHGTNWYEMASDNLVVYNEHPDDSLTFTFRGDSFSWYGYSERIGGKADIYINGDFVETIDTYNSTDDHTQLLFESERLTGGEQHVEIFVRESNEMSEGNRVVVESIEIH